MFLCDDCHNTAAHIELFRSRGRCECCGKTANCIDCHYQTCNKNRRVAPKWKREKPKLPRAPVTMNAKAGPMRDRRTRLRAKAEKLDND